MTLDQFIENLPPFIGKEIITFITTDSTLITFKHHLDYKYNNAYNLKYDVAFIGDKVIKNKNGTYLSRIAKKNGKHRYYLTDEHEHYTCNGCGRDGCCSSYCRGSLEYYYSFNSKFVGNNLDKALLEVFL